MAGLTGRTALVTGASRGIGRAIARRLAADGALVAVHYGSDRDAALAVVAEIGQAGGRAFAVGADLGADDGVDTLFAALAVDLRERVGELRLDIVVNNAAIGGRAGAIDTATPAEFDRVFAVNVRAPFFIVQRALPLLPEGGRIVNISSADTRIAISSELAYTMTKGALNAMGRTLANAVGVRGITVNTVAPGVTDTGKLGWLQADPELLAATNAATALDRVGRPEDIADVVAFLASDDARWVTGHLLDASGGMFLGPRMP